MLPAGTVERLLHVDNGVALRLYLLLCQGANNLDNDTICRRLGVTDEELAKAESCLISHGLASRASQNPCNSEMTRDRESVPVYTREEIARETGLPLGGGLSDTLLALIESDFVLRYTPYGKPGNVEHYKLIDNFCLFWLKYVEENQMEHTLY